MNFKNGVKKIQAAAYNGARTVIKVPSINFVVSGGGRGVAPKTIYYIDPT